MTVLFALCLVAVVFAASRSAHAIQPPGGLAAFRDGERPRRAEGNFRHAKAGERLVLLDTPAAGCIRHIWITIPKKDYSEDTTPMRHIPYKQLVLRMYWDGADEPSVETPIGDFFLQGFGKHYPVSSELVAIGGESTGLNCYIPMPFAKGARIEVENQGAEDVKGFYHYVDYVEFDGPEAVADQGRLHAQYRQEFPVTPGNYVFLEAEGRGVYIGCNLQTHAMSGGWWGEGEDYFRLDGDKKWTLIGTGTEDYFCNGWGFEDKQSHPYFGSPFFTLRNGKSLLYRWHVPDPIAFRKSIHAEIQHHGHIWDSRADELAGKPMANACTERMGDYFQSLAYYYLDEARPTGTTLPGLASRMPMPLIHPRNGEVVIHEDVRAVVLNDYETGLPAAGVWHLYGKVKALRLNVEGAKDVKVVDVLGGECEVKQDGDALTVPLANEARYIHLAGFSRERLQEMLKAAEFVE